MVKVGWGREGVSDVGSYQKNSQGTESSVIRRVKVGPMECHMR